LRFLKGVTGNTDTLHSQFHNACAPEFLSLTDARLQYQLEAPMKTTSKMLIGLSLFYFGSVTVLSQKPNAPSGNSNMAHLYLAEKNPANWVPVPGGAWGKMVYTTSGASFGFVFNGHKLDSDIAYTLMYYPDPWPGNGAICLGQGVGDASGNVHIQGNLKTGDLPVASDQNATSGTTTYDSQQTGAKIWLVLSSDVSCSGHHIVSWHPTEYLFEMHLINFTQTP
jgi:hypothetical protein